MTCFEVICLAIEQQEQVQKGEQHPCPLLSLQVWAVWMTTCETCAIPSCLS